MLIALFSSFIQGAPSKATPTEYDFVVRVAESEFYSRQGKTKTDIIRIRNYFNQWGQKLKCPKKVRQKFNAKIVQAAERVCWQLARGIYSKYASAANLLLNFTAEWDMLCLK